MTKGLLLLIGLQIVASFDIIEHKQYPADLKRGQKVTLMCKSDGSWEYCDWIHKGSQGDRHCKMEWKYAKNAVVVTDCHKDIKSRTRRVGNYEAHECGLELTSVTLQDAGEWECQMEQYVSGFFSGTRHTRTFNVDVTRRTTKATTRRTTTVTTTTTTAPTTTSESTTTTENMVISTVVPEVETTAIPEDTPTEEIVETTDHKASEEYVEQNFVSNLDEKNETLSYPDLENTIEEEEASVASLKEVPGGEGGNSGTIAGVVVVLVIVIMAGLGGGLAWMKKRRETDIITLQKIKEENKGGTNAFLEEAEYSMSSGFTNLTPPE